MPPVDFSRGVSEWVVSRADVASLRLAVGDRLFEPRHADLCRDAGRMLDVPGRLVEVPSSSAWIHHASSVVLPPERDSDNVVLPPRLSDAFNRIQERFRFSGFAGRGAELS